MDEINEKEFYEANELLRVKELIWQSQSGEVWALEKLLRIYEKLILRISKKYYFQDGDVQDVIQECYIAFWQSVMNYKDHENAIGFESFAYICINRKLASALRKRTKKGTSIHVDAMLGKTLPIEDIYKIEKNILVAKDNVENEFILREARKEYFNKIKMEMSNQSGEIIRLREAGYSYKEIGELLNISTKKVDNTIVQIRKKINNSDILN